MTTSREPKTLISRFVAACGLFLVAVAVLTIALDLLAKIWVWVALIVVLTGLVATVIWIVRRRRARW